MSSRITSNYRPPVAGHGTHMLRILSNSAPALNGLDVSKVELSVAEIAAIERRMRGVERAYERYDGVVQRLIKRLHASVVIDGKIVQERSFVQSLALKYIGILAPLWQSISRDYFECKKVQAKILAGGVNEKNGFLLHIKIFMDGDPAIGCLSEKNLLKNYL